MIEEKVFSLIEPRIKDLGYRLVLVRLDSVLGTIQVMIDFLEPADKSIAIDDCITVTDAISYLLSVESQYNKFGLEVTSPGLDRPLVILSDFQRFKGSKAQIVLKEVVEELRKFKATISDVIGKEIVFELLDLKKIKVVIDNIASAKLVIDDEMLFRKNKK